MSSERPAGGSSARRGKAKKRETETGGSANSGSATKKPQREPREAQNSQDAQNHRGHHHQHHKSSSSHPSRASAADIQAAGVRAAAEAARKADEEAAADPDAHFCIICVARLKFCAVSQCNHTTCHTCTFRMRALYKRQNCLVCRTESERVVIYDVAEGPDKAYLDFYPEEFAVRDNEYGIDFSSQEAYKHTFELLENRCPMGSCEKIFPSFSELAKHTEKVHSKMYCLLCAKFKHSFPCELKLYTGKQLHNHQTRGDAAGFPGHPRCRFCNSMFYSEDELLVHMRDRHEKCHICSRDRPANEARYFRDYDELFQHFKTQHFVCLAQICLDKKFVVFETEFDLQAHRVTEHGMSANLLTAAATGSADSLGGSSAGGRRNRHASRLSTFDMSTVSGSLPGADGDTAEVRARRLEERAKNYLRYATAPFQEFSRATGDFRNGKISARVLVDRLRHIFTTPETDLDLLLHDLCETLPTNSPRRQELSQEIMRAAMASSSAEVFPALARSGSAASLVAPPTVAYGRGGAVRKPSAADFPALARSGPAASSAPSLLALNRAAPPAATQGRPVRPGKPSASDFPPLNRGKTGSSSGNTGGAAWSVATAGRSAGTSRPSASSASASASASSSSASLSALSRDYRTFASPRSANTGPAARFSDADFPELPKSSKYRPVVSAKAAGKAPMPNAWAKQPAKPPSDSADASESSEGSSGGKRRRQKKQVLLHMGI